MINYIGFEADLENENAHLTLWVLPEEPSVEHTEKINKILEEFKHYSIGARFKNFDNFGPNKDIPVIKVANELLFNAIRKKIMDTGVADASSYAFNPHITIPEGMDPIIIPRIISLHSIFADINGNIYA